MPSPRRVASVRGAVHTPERIEFLYVDDCPSHPEALALLRGVLDERGISCAVELHEVRSDEEASALAFPGSPTIRIDGHDVDPAGAAGRPTLGCRIYRLPDGRFSPVPQRSQIEAALA